MYKIRQITDTHKKVCKTKKQPNLDILDSEGDRGIKEDDGKDAGDEGDFYHDFDNDSVGGKQ